MLFFIGAGAAYVRPENWYPFMPYGWSGVMGAAGVVFFAYIGFDAVSTTAEEAKNPQRDLPIGIIASLVICTLLYLAVAAVLSRHRARSSTTRRDQAFLNAPVAFALSLIGQDWAAYLVSAGAVAGITSVLLVMLMSQPRIFFAMSRDGLLPQGVSKVHPRFGTPYITTIITCVIVAIVAGLTQIQVGGRDDQHRHAVRVRRRLRGGAGAAQTNVRTRTARSACRSGRCSRSSASCPAPI